MSKKKRRRLNKVKPMKPVAGFEIMVKFFVWEEEGLSQLMEDVEDFIFEVDEIHTISDLDITPIYEEEIDGQA